MGYCAEETENDGFDLRLGVVEVSPPLTSCNATLYCAPGHCPIAGSSFVRIVSYQIRSAPFSIRFTL